MSPMLFPFLTWRTQAQDAHWGANQRVTGETRKPHPSWVHYKESFKLVFLPTSPPLLPEPFFQLKGNLGSPLPQGFSQTCSLVKKFLAHGEPLSLQGKKEPEPTVWFLLSARSQLRNQRRKNTGAGVRRAARPALNSLPWLVPVLWSWFLNVHFNHVSLKSPKNKMTSSKTDNFS